MTLDYDSQNCACRSHHQYLDAASFHVQLAIARRKSPTKLEPDAPRLRVIMTITTALANPTRRRLLQAFLSYPFIDFACSFPVVYSTYVSIHIYMLFANNQGNHYLIV